ncbi:MAG: cob(I)yrinic acid a,c-diamide adenosyltransferase [Clostridia bacterium]|nr:cob(I)yrinic acid a,c-diamide adenosyltransferase [Clostridia bacterium]
MEKLETGLIEIYCGEGKGKTTAALGLCLRARGRGANILWTSFLKDYDSGEFLGDMPFDLFKGEPVRTFFWLMTPEEKGRLKLEHCRRLQQVFREACSGHYDILVLDEVLGALQNGSLDLQILLDELKSKTKTLEVVMTGRCAPQALKAAADYISCIQAEKHPFQKGTAARIGIEI